MKRIYKLLVVGALIVFATACAQKEHELSIEKSTVQLRTGEEVPIGSNLPAEWSSSDEFVASVDAQGVVIGEHVGTATVTAVSGSDRRECIVEVLPKYETYIEPAYQLFLQSPALLEEAETRELLGREDNIIRYKGEKPYIKEVEYFLSNTEDEKIIRACIVISISMEDEVIKFLSERYRWFRTYETYIQYYNNIDLSTMTIVFDKYVQDPDSIMVIYLPNIQ